MNTSDTVRKKLDPGTSIQGLTAAFAALDANRAAGYGTLGHARAAKSALLAREQKLLAIKHGSSGHPRVRQAADALTHNERLRREMAAAQEVLETPAPEVDPDTFVVHGFVRRRDQTGIPGLTLALTSADGVWLRTGGYACTDQRGYFELRIQGKATDKEPVPGRTTPATEETKQEAAAKAEAERKAAAEKAQAAATGISSGLKTNLPPQGSGPEYTAREQAAARAGVQLRVFDREGRVLHVERRLVVPMAGGVDYRLIVLDDEGCGCTPPPEKSEGKPAPSAPRAPVAPPAAPKQPAPGAAAPRVANLKSYESPPAASEVGQPLETIRGIGPKTADKLRAIGIDDVAEFKRAEGAVLVKLAGFDKTPPKPSATKASETAKPAATAKTTTDKTAPERTAAAAAAEKAAEAAGTKATARKAATTKAAKTTTKATAAAKTKKSPK